NAGPAQSVHAGDAVRLDGTGSSDGNRDPLTFKWALTSRPDGSGASLGSTADPRPTFATDVAGTYVATLVVNDGQVDSAPATVVITATPPAANSAPTANAGNSLSVATGTVVTLDGRSSYDPD